MGQRSFLHTASSSNGWKPNPGVINLILHHRHFMPLPLKPRRLAKPAKNKRLGSESDASILLLWHIHRAICRRKSRLSQTKPGIQSEHCWLTLGMLFQSGYWLSLLQNRDIGANERKKSYKANVPFCGAGVCSLWAAVYHGGGCQWKMTPRQAPVTAKIGHGL